MIARFRTSTVTWSLASLVVLGLSLWAVTQVSGNEPRLQPDDSAIVALGGEVYERECAVCHGQNLEGQPNWRQRKADGRLPAPPHDVTGHTWHHSDLVLFELTKNGLAVAAGPDYETDMPAFGEILSDREIIAVLSFIKSRWPPAIQARQDRLNEGRSQ